LRTYPATVGLNLNRNKGIYYASTSLPHSGKQKQDGGHQLRSRDFLAGLAQQRLLSSLSLASSSSSGQQLQQLQL